MQSVLLTFGHGWGMLSERAGTAVYERMVRK